MNIFIYFYIIFLRIIIISFLSHQICILRNRDGYPDGCPDVREATKKTKVLFLMIGPLGGGINAIPLWKNLLF